MNFWVPAWSAAVSICNADRHDLTLAMLMHISKWLLSRHGYFNCDWCFKCFMSSQVSPRLCIPQIHSKYHDF